VKKLAFKKNKDRVERFEAVLSFGLRSWGLPREISKDRGTSPRFCFRVLPLRVRNPARNDRDLQTVKRWKILQQSWTVKSYNGIREIRLCGAMIIIVLSA
jgi:hypothetical protein